MDEHDWELRITCLKIAAEERIWGEGPIVDIKELFQRTKDLYDSAVGEADFFGDWKKFWDKKPKEEPKPVEKEPVKVVEGDMKVCPKCSEEVPAAWKAHKFKSDGKPCGHKF